MSMNNCTVYTLKDIFVVNQVQFLDAIMLHTLNVHICAYISLVTLNEEPCSCKKMNVHL